MVHPKFDREFLLQTDALDIGLGAILSQLDDNGVERPIAYASKILSGRERKYCTTEKEAFAVIFSIRTFRTYLLGRPFKVITDHSALKWLDNMHLKGRLERWVMELQEFQFSVIHKPGTLHSNADALSRLVARDQSTENTLNTASNSRHDPANNSCAITLNPTVNLRKAQQDDPSILKVIQMKTSRTPDPAIVVPKALETEILKGTHDSPFTGHLGVTRTLDRIRKRFFWPNMRKTVENYIRQCDTCAKRKAPAPTANNGTAPLQSLQVSEPFTFWALDYMGPLPETHCGNKHILVLMDHFTKWCEAFPTPDQKASTIAKILVDRVFSRFGPPVVLHSDQGANFKSTLMHEVCDVMGITKTRTTAYHPQCDGQVERQNRTLQDMLAAFCTKHDNDWDLWIDAAVFAYNTSRQESLQTSPYEIVFGRIPRLPLELELGLPLKDPSTQSEYTQSLRKVFQEVREVARQNLEKARKKQRKNNEERIQTWRPFAPGETVYLRRPKGWKLGAKWIGPFEIVCRMGVDYKIRSNQGKITVVHHDRLKRGYAPVNGGKVVCPAPELGSDQVVYTVPTGNVRPHCDNAPHIPRVRPRNLRQNVHAPDRYGFAVL